MLPFSHLDPVLIHASFEAAGISAGACYYRAHHARQGLPFMQWIQSNNIFIILCCILGAGIGNRLMYWIEMPHQLWQIEYWQQIFSGGQSIVGGLLGGWLGVELAKKFLGQQESTGDAFVYPILLGIIIGRLGCFFAGLADGTYGLPSTLPWAVDFGDGIPRHPTQLYEIVFIIVLWSTLAQLRTRLSIHSGLLFKCMLNSYLLWRLVIDGIKPLPFDYGLGLSGIQWVCLLVLMCYLPHTWFTWKTISERTTT